MLLFAFASLLSCLLAAPPGKPCGENEVLVCLPCYEESCSVPYYSDNRCSYTCNLDCGCKPGYVRHDKTNQCVSMYECNRLFNSHAK
ncbi:PREDICTED: uncharacterized protein LOC108621041 [Drosophila arizonae]|uniref:Uncharacterized protein LOC108621041 n=1 Tax=Drosophila arizonae TaxID=7263 RepID=A0ABM1Q2D4_DROAR|nr:PREDICTED: uncharacterized protein LOC108621041 [Drosophila arizonae]